MILILDNNQDYSDHEIDFVECPSELVPDALALAVALKWGVLGVADKVEWRDGESLKLGEWVGPHSLTLSNVPWRQWPSVDLPADEAVFIATSSVGERRLYFLNEPVVDALTPALLAHVLPDWENDTWPGTGLVLRAVAQRLAEKAGR